MIFIETLKHNKVAGQNPLILDGKVYVKQDENGNYEPLDVTLKRFKKVLQKSGKMIEYRKHEFYESKSIKRRRKHENALKREQRELKKQQKYYYSDK